MGSEELAPSSRSDKESIFNPTQASSGTQSSESEPLYLCSLRFDERHLRSISVRRSSRKDPKPSTAEMEINREDYSRTCGEEDFNGEVTVT